MTREAPVLQRSAAGGSATACLLALASVAFAQADGNGGGPPAGTPLPQASDVLGRALERTARKEKSKIELEFQCSVDSALETLDGQGGVSDVETKRSRRYPLEGYLYDEVVERDGKALTPEQAQRERQRKEDFVREARRQAERGQRLESDRRRMRFNRELMDRYRPSLGGSEVVGGAECWVVEFEPRDGDLPRNRPMDRALNRSSGRLWIMQSNDQVVRVEFAMNSPIRYLMGLFATLRKADGSIEFAEVEEGLWMPSRFQIDLDLQLLMGVKAIRRRIRNTWSDYRRIDSEAEAAASL